MNFVSHANRQHNFLTGLRHMTNTFSGSGLVSGRIRARPAWTATESRSLSVMVTTFALQVAALEPIRLQPSRSTVCKVSMLTARALTRCGCSGLPRSVRRTLSSKPRQHVQAARSYFTGGPQGGPPQQQPSKGGTWGLDLYETVYCTA